MDEVYGKKEYEYIFVVKEERVGILDSTFTIQSVPLHKCV